MALTATAAKQIIIIGIIEIVVGLMALVCGIVTMTKMTSPAGATIGLWALYFGIPAGLCIAAGYDKGSSMTSGALAANIIGTILAVVALIIGGLIWTVVNQTCVAVYTGPQYNQYYHLECRCLYNSAYYYYDAECDDLQGIIKDSIGVVTIMYVILVIVSFIGSIFGCISACCGQQEPGLIITTGAAQQPQAIVVANTNVGYSGYNPPAYAPQPSYAQHFQPQHQGYPGVQQGAAYPGGIPPPQAYPGGEYVNKPVQ